MIFTMCPVAATQRMFSGCGDKETITPPLRRDIPSAWVWQPMGPVADLHQSDTDVQASLPQLASVGDTLPSQAQQVSGQHTALRTSLAANTYCPPVPLPPPPHKQQPAPAVTPNPCCHPRPFTLRSRWRTCMWCMKRMPSQICRTNTMQSTSVRW